MGGGRTRKKCRRYQSAIIYCFFVFVFYHVEFVDSRPAVVSIVRPISSWSSALIFFNRALSFCSTLLELLRITASSPSFVGLYDLSVARFSPEGNSGVGIEAIFPDRKFVTCYQFLDFADCGVAVSFAGCENSSTGRERRFAV